MCSLRGAATGRLLPRIRALGLVGCDLRPRRALNQPPWAVLSDVLGCCSRLQSLVIHDQEDPLEAAMARARQRERWRFDSMRRPSGHRGVGPYARQARHPYRTNRGYNGQGSISRFRQTTTVSAGAWLPHRHSVRSMWTTTSIRKWAGALVRCQTKAATATCTSDPIAGARHEWRSPGLALQHLDISGVSECCLFPKGVLSLLAASGNDDRPTRSDISGSSCGSDRADRIAALHSRPDRAPTASRSSIKSIQSRERGAHPCLGTGLLTLCLPRSASRGDSVHLSHALAMCPNLVGLQVDRLHC